MQVTEADDRENLGKIHYIINATLQRCTGIHLNLVGNSGN